MGAAGSGGQHIPWPVPLSAVLIGLEQRTAVSGSCDWLNLWTLQTNTAATLKPVIMQGTEFSCMEWKSINFMKKLIQIQTDIIFLSKCKQMDIIPKGLKIFAKPQT
ncbi:hypothetical protein UY3_05958 [Chelonia mydas]|uniref:Uncharacterized protein n=1 Tax=Chelonia mydas TaxID=8469 RepID=M7BI68_CHEMY|nr:hypothetical protein UY3_05958 [Chelonia mydas]